VHVNTHCITIVFLCGADVCVCAVARGGPAHVWSPVWTSVAYYITVLANKL